MAEELFRTAPREVVAYFDRRPSVPTFDWRDLAAREHALAFTVAKTAGAEVLEDIRAAVRRAVVDRVPWEQFRADLEPTLRAKGWWGEKRQRDDVTGEERTVQLGSPRRLRTIYWANTAAAHAAGEWERTQRTKRVLPYLVYVMSVAARKRPEHLRWVGTALPVDHEWWRTHYPPNAWNCRCSVRQISPYEYENGPLVLRREPTDDGPPQAWRNKRTGEVEQVPPLIDPGWQHNPGERRDRTVSRGLATALDRMPEPARRAAVEQLSRHPLMEYVASGQASRDNHAPLAVLPEALGSLISAKTTIVRASGEIGEKAMRLGGTGKPHHPEATPESYALVQEAIDRGRVIQKGDRKLLIDRRADDGLWWRAALTATWDGTEVFLSSWHKVSAKNVASAARALWVDGSRPVAIIREDAEK